MAGASFFRPNVIDFDGQNYNTKAEMTAALDDKVSKEAGKGLSTNDFTDLQETYINNTVPAVLSDHEIRIAGIESTLL